MLAHIVMVLTPYFLIVFLGGNSFIINDPISYHQYSEKKLIKYQWFKIFLILGDDSLRIYCQLTNNLQVVRGKDNVVGVQGQVGFTY